MWNLTQKPKGKTEKVEANTVKGGREWEDPRALSHAAGEKLAEESWKIHSIRKSLWSLPAWKLCDSKRSKLLVYFSKAWEQSHTMSVADEINDD